MHTEKQRCYMLVLHGSMLLLTSKPWSTAKAFIPTFDFVHLGLKIVRALFMNVSQFLNCCSVLETTRSRSGLQLTGPLTLAPRQMKEGSQGRFMTLFINTINREMWNHPLAHTMLMKAGLLMRLAMSKPSPVAVCRNTTCYYRLALIFNYSTVILNTHS